MQNFFCRYRFTVPRLGCRSSANYYNHVLQRHSSHLYKCFLLINSAVVHSQRRTEVQHTHPSLSNSPTPTDVETLSQLWPHMNTLPQQVLAYPKELETKQTQKTWISEMQLPQLLQGWFLLLYVNDQCYCSALEPTCPLLACPSDNLSTPVTMNIHCVVPEFFPRAGQQGSNPEQFSVLAKDLFFVRNRGTPFASFTHAPAWGGCAAYSESP